MSQKSKLSPEEKVKIIHKYMNIEVSLRVPSRVMRKFICRRWLNEINQR